MTTAGAGPLEGPASAVPGLGDDTEIWLVRHGETEWSRNGQHTSVTDLPLTELGERQAAAVRELLDGVSPALVLCSPRRRALDTARLAGLDVDGVDDDLVEWNYGAYEGRTSVEIGRDIEGWTIWTHGAPGGDTFEQVQQRADRALSRAVEHSTDGPVVLVGHGHFSRVLGARWVGLPVAAGANLLLDTAAPSVLGAQHGVAAIERWNIPNPAR